MRSVYASMLALALTVLLCACVSRVPVWETVDDEVVCQMPRRPSTIVFAVPDGWASDVFSPDGLSRQYTAPDGSYEISATVFETSDPESAIRQLTGLDASRFDLIRTTRFSLPEYQFAWSAETDGGDRLYRAAMLCDEHYCYALCFSAPAAPARAMIAYRSLSLQASGSITTRRCKFSEIGQKTKLFGRGKNLFAFFEKNA